MDRYFKRRLIPVILRLAIAIAAITSVLWAANAPVPLLSSRHAVQWWFVFKLNSKAFPACGAGFERTCAFGGTVQKYKKPYGQQFVYASSENPTLQQGSGCVGETTTDPVGATFAQVYSGTCHYREFWVCSGQPGLTGSHVRQSGDARS
jgi:hypothetical protein